ncbi:MAG: transposase [Pseudomonadota bacterium]|nr:transposase [Pseudomonadota bacterium]
MRRYIRSHLSGATYFFTVTLAERQGNDTLTRHIDALRTAVAQVKARHPFSIDAMVVLPDHLHCLWTLPPQDGDYSLRWRQIKSKFSAAIPKAEFISPSRQAKGERGIWQRRYWEHQIRDEEDFARHVDYIHYNPVKHGWAKTPGAWPYSSFHRYVREGRLPADWAAGGDDGGAMFGE